MNLESYALYPHQVIGVDFLARRGRAILGDGLGLGKTRQDADDNAILIEALKFAPLAERHLPDGQNKKTAATAIRHIAVRLSADQRRAAAELAASWRPLYQERYLMSDTPASK